MKRHIFVKAILLITIVYLTFQLVIIKYLHIFNLNISKSSSSNSHQQQKQDEKKTEIYNYIKYEINNNINYIMEGKKDIEIHVNNGLNDKQTITDQHKHESTSLVSNNYLKFDINNLFNHKLYNYESNINAKINELAHHEHVISDSLVKGINKNHHYNYKPDSNGLFKCLTNSGKQIPFSQVNDDYCDCDDGSDEPGTSACSNSVFYCDLQNEYLTKNYVNSHKVNDRICDCCDGSDEYNTGVKCENKCGEKIEIMKKEIEKKKLAMRLKKDYLIEGRLKDENLYGPEGIFYKLSHKCFQIHATEFSYDVCPYVRVSQKSKGHTTDLGNHALLKQESSFWTLHMENGEAKFCTHARRSKIVFTCSLDENVSRVEELEQCVYTFYLNTPAAC